MNRELALYNVHKRATLDRLTLTYQLQVRAIYRGELSHVEPNMVSALNAHHSNFNPEIPGSHLNLKLEKVFAAFQDAAIKAGVSDGLQEVSPENKLNLWTKYPIGMPVENTIYLEGGKKLTDERRDIIDQFKNPREKTLIQKINLYVKNSKDAYLKNIRQAYGKASKSWFEGDRDIADVKALLRRSLVSTDSEAERTLRTETTNYFNETRADYFATQTDVDYLQFYAVTDGRISHICEDRHGFCFPIDRAKDKDVCPACHPHCRSLQRPLFTTITSNKRIINQYSDHSMNGKTESQWAPLPKGWA